MAAIFFVLAAGGVSADAESLFATLKGSIYQVLIIEARSGEKASIGSGFQVTADGLVATNFHVIADAVHNPEKYRIEYLDVDGRGGSLSVVDFDVVHDLALVRHVEGRSDHLDLAADRPNQGEDLFALGNPLDLGQTIVAGAYNGLVEKSFYRKFLFAGSLNPGMSGGPTVNHDGRVVGVNVATSGNQISFLVPVEHLTRLVASPDRPSGADGYRRHIEQQLLDDQQRKYGELLAEDWLPQVLGDAEIVTAPTGLFECWGDTDDDEDQRYESTQSVCLSQDDLYISSQFSTGAIDYQFQWVTTDELSSLQFHSLYGSLYGTMFTRNRARKEDVTNFQCHQDFVKDASMAAGVWRTVFCARQYRRYERLYDVLFLSAHIGAPGRGLIAHFALSGVTRENALEFARRFMNVNSWQS